MKPIALVFATVPLGYGSPQFIHFYQVLESASFASLIVEPSSSSRPSYPIAGVRRLKVPSSRLLGILVRFAILLTVIMSLRKGVLLTGADLRFPLPWLINKRLKTVRLYIEISDNFDDEMGRYPPEGPLIINSRIASGYLSKFISWFFGPVRYDVVIAPQADRLAIARNLYPEAKQALLVLNVPPSQKSVRRSKTLGRRPVILYQGQLHSVYTCAESLLVAIESAYERFEFVVAGPCREEHVRQRLEELHTHGKVRYHGVLRQDDLQVLRNQAHISLVLWDNIRLATRYAAPNKLFESIAAGLPVVCTPNQSLQKWNAQFEFGRVMAGYSGKDILDALNTLTSDRAEYARISSGNIIHFEQELNFEYQSGPFLEWLKKR